VCVQLLMELKFLAAFSLYVIIAVIAGVLTLMLPIETKGRTMTVCSLRPSHFHPGTALIIVLQMITMLKRDVLVLETCTRHNIQAGAETDRSQAP